MRILAVPLAAALVWASPGAAKAPSVNLLGSFKPVLAKIEHSSAVPVLLPASFPILDKLKVYASGGANETSWDLELAFAPNCRGATACFLASFEGQKTASLPAKPNARLAGGDPALFEKSTCGARVPQRRSGSSTTAFSTAGRTPTSPRKQRRRF